MKKLLVILFMMMPMVSVAQNFNEDGGKYEVYCDIMNATPSNVNGTYSIYIGNNSYVIVDKDGERLIPKKDSEILSLLAKRGWRLVTCYYKGYDKTKFIMRKEVNNDDEARTGLQKDKK